MIMHLFLIFYMFQQSRNTLHSYSKNVKGYNVCFLITLLPQTKSSTSSGLNQVLRGDSSVTMSKPRLKARNWRSIDLFRMKSAYRLTNSCKIIITSKIWFTTASWGNLQLHTHWSFLCYRKLYECTNHCFERNFGLRKDNIFCISESIATNCCNFG